MNEIRRSVLLLTVFVLFNATNAVLADSTLTSKAQTVAEQELHWLDDYATARNEALTSGKMLLIYFFEDEDDATRQSFEQTTLADAEVRQLCRDYVLLRVPRTAKHVVDGDEFVLLHHASFSAMNGQAGLATVDFMHRDQPYYKHTVSCLPFERPVYYAPPYHGIQSVRTLLSLPPGTISQRTMVYAVRLHPEGPNSTNGSPNSVLFEAARQHSTHQASIRLQGHHNWDSRFHRLFGRLGGQPPVEVCAESWPGKGLLGACIDCVDAWHHSSGHWRAVRRNQPAYGYDIRRGSNGIWYATGIFGGRLQQRRG